MIIEALKTKQEFLSHKADINYTINPIKIKDAIDGRQYYCKDCGTVLFTRRPAYKAHSFVHAPGKPHTEDICRTKESEKKTPTANVKSFKLNQFFISMIDAIKFKFIKEHNIGNDEDPIEEENWPEWEDDEDIPSDNQDIDNPSTETDDVPLDIDHKPNDDNKDDREYISLLSPIKTIKHVIECSYERYDPDTIINDTYNTKVRDLIYSVPIFKEFFATPDLLNNLDRIVEMEPVTIFHKDKRFEEKSYILSKIFRYNREIEDYENIYFRLFIHQEDEYGDILNNIFTKVGKDRNLISKYSSIFVINHWTLSDTPNYFKGKSYITYDTDIYDYTKQIYTPSKYKNKENKKRKKPKSD